MRLTNFWHSLNTPRNWICMSVGWLAGLLAYCLTPTSWLGVLVCFAAGFIATLIAQWISRFN
jgi:uncharacterized membrane protein YeaQ/YmgE (transglycosylase-associated protein family)